MKILIVKLSAIGDVIHTLPVLNALRSRYPDARITWLIEEAAAPLVIGHPALDRVLILRRKSWIKGLRERGGVENIAQAFRFIQALRDTEYDMVLDLQSLLKSGIPIALSRAKRKIGFDRGMQHMEGSYLFLNERIAPVNMEIHALTRGLLLIEALGIKTEEIVYNLPISAQDRLEAGELLFHGGPVGARPVVAIHPIGKWTTKLWDGEKFSLLADKLVERYGARIFFTGSPGDRPVIDAWISGMEHGAENLAGKTNLKTLAALYEHCDFVVSTDTGPMHLAAAVGTPVVALFGPTAPWRTGPFGKGHQIIRAEVACAPCFKRVCDTKECMARISVSQVLDHIQTLVSSLNDAFGRSRGPICDKKTITNRITNP